MKNVKLLGIVGALVLVGASVFLAYALTFTGTAAADFMQGTSSQDRMWGMGGNDTVNGGGGSDFIWGDCGNGSVLPFIASCAFNPGHAAGSDILYGGPWHDRIFGEDGTDTIFGNNGNDYIEGGPGNDIIGDDNWNGWCNLTEEPGSDFIFGDQPLGSSVATATIIPTDGNDIICGGDAHDSIWGGGGTDVIWGGRGPNRIAAGPGNDIIYIDPNSRKDIINCGPGTDTVFLFGNTRALHSPNAITFGPPWIPITAPGPVGSCEFIIP